MKNWNNWKWQLENRISTISDLSKYISTENAFYPDDTTLQITPYIASVMAQHPKSRVLQKQFIGCNEKRMLDALNEKNYEPVDNLIDKYKNKVAFLINNNCACYCKFCTRQRFMSKQKQKFNYDDAISYIKENQCINDVLLTGGDPFLLETKQLKKILDALFSIEHVNIVRFGTRLPITLPMRFDKKLLTLLKKYSPLYINIHVNHPYEITKESSKVILSLANAGIPLGSQTVLLKDINNDISILRQLFEKLVSIKVKPYYIYQCDKISGYKNYFVPLKQGIELINSLNGAISGFAVPRYIIDTPNDIGKLTLAPNNIVSINETSMVLKNYKNDSYVYNFCEEE